VARWTEHEGVDAGAAGKTARLRKIGLSEWTRIRKKPVG